MADPALGILTPTDPAKVLAKAADVLGVEGMAWPTNRARIDRVARAIYRTVSDGPWKLANQGIVRRYYTYLTHRWQGSLRGDS